MEDLFKSFARLQKSYSKALKVLNIEKAKKWSTKYINSLPNKAFAVVEKDYKEGKDKRARHLPHHTKEVKKATQDSTVDLVHFRNALSRVNQIKSVLGKESDSTLRKRASKHLKVHMNLLDSKKEKSSFSKDQEKIYDECRILFRERILPLLADD